MDLSAYRAAWASGPEMGPMVEASGLRCGKCGSGRCARRHAVRYRKRITDLSTGKVFENLPILRVVFCDGTTGSLTPSEVWRGRFTVSSVLEAVVRVHRDGCEAASEWALYAATGEEVVSERSLRRWRDLVRTRLIGSAFSWLAPQIGLSWSDNAPAAAQLEKLFDRITGNLLLGFRALTGRAVLDKPSDVSAPAHSTPRRILGRLSPDPPHTPPLSRRPRGSWLRRTRRESPGRDPQEQRPPPQEGERR